MRTGKLQFVPEDPLAIPTFELKSDDEVGKHAIHKAANQPLQRLLTADSLQIRQGDTRVLEAVMPFPFPHLPPEQRGRVELLYHDSAALKDNFWGDPVVREVRVYTPPGYQPTERLPILLFLPGYSGTGEQMFNRGMQEVPFSTRADRWIADGTSRFIAVLPDVMTRLGGSQYLDSPAIGNYATWLAKELVPWISARFPATHWGVLGRSSGGFGAIHLALTFPGVFSAVGCLSGDCGFDLCYLGDVPQAMLGFGAAPERFLADFWTAEKTSSHQFSALNLLCMSCAYSPYLRAVTELILSEKIIK